MNTDDKFNLRNEVITALATFISVSKRKYNELTDEGYYVTSVKQINDCNYQIHIMNDASYERSIDSFGKVCNYGMKPNDEYLKCVYGESFNMTDILGTQLMSGRGDVLGHAIKTGQLTDDQIRAVVHAVNSYK